MISFKKVINQKVIILSGPTATGKTALATKLAKKYRGELISADSRQIYRGMNIGTGKDHSPQVPTHLVDIITPKQSFSVSQYQKMAHSKIEEISARNHLPVVVGGTGQYIDSIQNYRSTYSVKPIKWLRFILNKLSVVHLRKLYSFFDKKSYTSLNNSDLHNPHRLIRKIEIKLSHPIKNFKPARPTGGLEIKNYNVLHLSLTAPNEYLYAKIDERVAQRLKMGLLDEIKQLLTKYRWTSPGLNCLAYKDFKPYFNFPLFKGNTPVKYQEGKGFCLNNCISRWRYHEHAYSRRQKTWFKKCPNVQYFNISQPDYYPKLLEAVEIWYNKP